MRTLLALLAASTLIGGCGCVEVNYLHVDDEPVATSSTVDTVMVPPFVDRRIPGGWWYDPTAEPEQMCSAPTAPAGLSIPCRNVLQLCSKIPETGEWANVIMPAVFSCSDESPTWKDLCATRPEVEWEFYGVSREECAAASDG